MILRYFWATIVVFLFSVSSHGTESETIQQKITNVAKNHLQKQWDSAKSRPDDRVEISVTKLDPRLKLRPCDKPLTVEGSKAPNLGGRTTLKVSCDGKHPWSMHIPASVKLFRQVVVSAHPLTRGSLVQESDLDFAEVNVVTLSKQYTTDIAPLVGKELTRSIMANSPINPKYLKEPAVVNKGDAVVVIAHTGAISVRIPGVALAEGHVGQQIRVRNERSKRIVKARIIGPGEVQVLL